MRLRTKLVVAVVGLSTVGLAVLGATTYSLYSSAEFARRDDQLRAIAMPVGTRTGVVPTSMRPPSRQAWRSNPDASAD